MPYCRKSAYKLPPGRWFSGELDGMPCRCASFEISRKPHPSVLAGLQKLAAAALALRREPCPAGWRITVFFPQEDA